MGCTHCVLTLFYTHLHHYKGAWIWADGFQVSYTNWNANEPNSVKV